MKLNDRIQSWVEAGLIDRNQARSIQDFESNRQSRPYAMYSFIILGVTVISIGIISLIAANWEAIPDWVKLTGDLIILCTAALLIFQFRENHIIHYSLSVFYALFVLASIGLISQVFHTGGELYEAIFLALFLTAPLMLLQRGRFLLHLWLVGFIYAFLYYMFEEHPFTSVGLGGVHILTTGSILLLASLLFRSGPEDFESHSRGSFFWGILLLTIASVWFSFADLEKGDVAGSGVEKSVLVPGILLICSAAYAFFMLPRTLERKVMILVTIGFLYLLFFMSLFVYPIGDKTLYLAIVFILLSLSAGITFFDYRFVFDTFLVLAGLRFLIIYFELFEDLATTGLGLILAGLIIIGAVIIYAKSRSRIQNYLKERLK